MRLVPTLAWNVGDPPQPVDPRLLPLLRAIRDTGSLAAAVAVSGLSYRAAWGLLRDYARRLQAPLVTMGRGRGAALTATAIRMLDAETAAASHVAGLARDLGVDLTPESAPGARARAPASASRRLPRLAIAASHDLALGALRERLAARGTLTLELSFMGSVHALQAFHAADAVVAGFHVPLPHRPGAAEVELGPLRRLLRVRTDRLVRFVEREQGLMLAPGNPLRVRNLRDLAARRARFVNRQPGSGTRLLIDALLARDGIAAARIRGYGTEEFTHRAVAATIAAGGADAGFGLRAAAVEHDLAFVPLAREMYYFAVKAAALRTPAVAALLDHLASPAFTDFLQAVPGYRAVQPGTVMPIPRS